MKLHEIYVNGQRLGWLMAASYTQEDLGAKLTVFYDTQGRVLAMLWDVEIR